MLYLVSLVILLLFYILGIVLIKKINRYELIDRLIPIVIFILYIVCMVYIYSNVGFNDWNFLNTLPTANVSPFTYCMIFIFSFFPYKIKKYSNTLVSFLSLGMVAAAIISMLFNALRDYKYHWHFVLDSFIHVLVSLYGVYLFKTKQVFGDRKNQLVGSSLIIFVSFIMLILNLIFKTSFFGLSLYGNHNIYNVVICKSSILSAIIYFCGLILVLFSGYLLQSKLLKKYYGY